MPILLLLSTQHFQLFILVRRKFIKLFLGIHALQTIANRAVILCLQVRLL